MWMTPGSELNLKVHLKDSRHSSEYTNVHILDREEVAANDTSYQTTTTTQSYPHTATTSIHTLIYVTLTAHTMLGGSETLPLKW